MRDRLRLIGYGFLWLALSASTLIGYLLWPIIFLVL